MLGNSYYFCCITPRPLLSWTCSLGTRLGRTKCRTKTTTVVYEPLVVSLGNPEGIQDHIVVLLSTEYLVPSLLQMINTDVRKRLPPPSTSAASLLVHFSAGRADSVPDSDAPGIAPRLLL